MYSMPKQLSIAKNIKGTIMYLVWLKLSRIKYSIPAELSSRRSIFLFLYNLTDPIMDKMYIVERKIHPRI